MNDKDRLIAEMEVFRDMMQKALSQTGILRLCNWAHAEQAQNAIAGLVRFMEMELIIGATFKPKEEKIHENPPAF